MFDIKLFPPRTRIPDDVAHLDHVVPTSKGGKNDADNVVAACCYCNVRKSNRAVGWRPFTQWSADS